MKRFPPALKLWSLLAIVMTVVFTTSVVKAAKPVVHGMFDLVEATIPGIQSAVDAGIIDSRQLVEMYLARIAAYDGMNTAAHLNSYMHVNTRAAQQAAE